MVSINITKIIFSVIVGLLFITVEKYLFNNSGTFIFFIAASIMTNQIVTGKKEK